MQETVSGTVTTNAPESKRWKFCPFDGTPLQDDWAHCPKCGEKIGQQAVQYVPYYVPYTAPQYPQTPNPWVWPNIGTPIVTWEYRARPEDRPFYTF